MADSPATSERHTNFDLLDHPPGKRINIRGGGGKTSLARALANNMLTSGPHARFVWSLIPDAGLDRHPDALATTGLTGWQTNDASGWLRVERQVTVPLQALKPAPEPRQGVWILRSAPHHHPLFHHPNPF